MSAGFNNKSSYFHAEDSGRPSSSSGGRVGPSNTSFIGSTIPQLPMNLPEARIDPQIVLKQKERALKELDSRVKLALSQHEKMYQIQRNHIVSEHDRQLLLTKSSIEYERASALMELESAFQQQVRSWESQGQSQKIQIEQQANVLEIHAVQQQMVRQHAEREQQWNSGYMVQQ